MADIKRVILTNGDGNLNIIEIDLPVTIEGDNIIINTRDSAHRTRIRVALDGRKVDSRKEKDKPSCWACADRYYQYIGSVPDGGLFNTRYEAPDGVVYAWTKVKRTEEGRWSPRASPGDNLSQSGLGRQLLLSPWYELQPLPEGVPACSACPTCLGGRPTSRWGHTTQVGVGCCQGCNHPITNCNCSTRKTS